MKPRTVLVTDGNERSALAIVRSLGHSGHRVHVSASRQRSLAGASRHATSETAVGTPEYVERYARSLIALTAELGADVVIPVTEASLRAVLPRRSEFPALIPFPDGEVFRAASDKRSLLEIARRLGIATPAEVVVTEPASLGESVGLPFPVVLKPSTSVVNTGEGQAKLSVSYASTMSELQRQVELLSPAAFPVLVQERIVGPGIGVFLLRWDGATRMSFAHRRIREKPPSGGVSTYRVAVPLDPDWLDQAESLLAALDWCGVAMVEFKLDGNRPVLMECNGRFWGSLQLAIDAGADFPAALVAWATGDVEARGPSAYRTGARSRWFWGDVDHLLLRLFRSATELHLPVDSPGRLRTLVEFMKFWRPDDRFEVARLNDPVPFLRESWSWIRGR